MLFSADIKLALNSAELLHEKIYFFVYSSTEFGGDVALLFVNLEVTY